MSEKEAKNHQHLSERDDLSNVSSLRIANFEAENTGLKVRVSSLQGTNGNLNAEITVLKEKLKSIQEENSSLMETNNNLVDRISQPDDNNNSSIIQPTHARHYRAPIFKGITDGDETKPYLWILDFKNCIKYHGWNEAQSLDEFMMTMHGSASLCGSNLDNATGVWAQSNDTGNQATPMEDVQMNPQKFKKKFYPQNTGNDLSSKVLRLWEIWSYS
ncbi:hypothetical protein BD770DRAFT_412154 [Pilaira anomala]|nr:hypothetical protein BD770DRAFT_412154 [Pilaira anomala]